MRGFWVVGSLTLLAACPGQSPTDPDAAPGDAVAGGGLTITFTATQDVPGMTAPDRTLDDVRFFAGSVRAFGDAAPGDARTTASGVSLRWHDATGPGPVHYDQAPVGMYTRVEVRLDGQGDSNPSFRIDGQALVNSTWYDYSITDDDVTTVAITTAVPLPLGGEATIPLQVDLASIIAGIDFTIVPITEGKLELEGEQQNISQAVRDAFSTP